MLRSAIPTIPRLCRNVLTAMSWPPSPPCPLCHAPQAELTPAQQQKVESLLHRMTLAF